MASKTEGLSMDHHRPSDSIPCDAATLPTPSYQPNLPGPNDLSSDDDALTLASLEINQPPHDTLSPSDQLSCTKPSSDAAASHPDTDESSPNVEESQNAASLRRNVWAPLQEGQMRLLGLMSGNSGRIGLRIQIVDIDSAPKYCALSYVCGDQISDCEIEVDGHLFLVRPNLFATLQELKRRNKHSTVEPLFWIDAISINQLDGDEKASQIRELHRIFSNADGVVIALGRLSENAALVFRVLRWAEKLLRLDLMWLPKRYKLPIIPESLDEPLWCSGPESLDNDTQERLRSLATHARAMEGEMSYTQLLAVTVLLRELMMSNDFATGANHLSEDELKQIMEGPLNLVKHIPSPIHAFWRGLNDLLAVKWFKRVWTYQEAQLAKRAVMYADGIAYPLDWYFCRANVLGLVTVIREGRLSDLFAVAIKERRLPLDVFKCLWDQLRTWYQFRHINKPLPLVEGLVYAGSREAREAKDHVYGIMGVLEPGVRARIQIDYALKDGEVFARAVKLCFSSDFLGAVIHLWSPYYDSVQAKSPQIEHLPSWFPELRSSYRLAKQVVHECVTPAVSKKYSTCAEYQDSPGSFHTIRVNVLKLDRVTRCMSSPPPVNVDLFNLPFKSLLADHDATDAILDWNKKLLQTFEVTQYKTLRALLNARGKGCIDFDTAFRHFEGLVLSLGGDQREAEKSAVILATAFSQCDQYLFETASGRVGFSVRRPVVGAVIVLVPGCYCLQMLAPNSTGYIGCATVDGLMGDTLLDPPPDLENEWEMVCLT
jgi:hypothetical protein